MNHLKKYMTIGIQENIPLALQIAMWQSLEMEWDKEIDYLQIFQIETISQKKSINMVRIIHSQEVPPREKVIYVDVNVDKSEDKNTDVAINEKVYIRIDEVQQIATMLLASEY